MENLQKEAVEHLKLKGFNCVVAPDNIFAWRPFMDLQGNSPILFTQTTIGNKVISNQFIPFFVAFVDCKKSKYLSKKRKQEIQAILEEGRCNLFLIAYKDKKGKLEFQEINLKQNLDVAEKKEKEAASYIG